MRVNSSGNRRIGRALGAAGVLAAFAFAPSAHALELRDMFIQFDTIGTYESKDSDENKVRRGGPDKSRGIVSAIAGTLVVPGIYSVCHEGTFSLVYKPGANSGTVSCPIKRVGTATSWSERGGSATFTTNTTVVGNVVTLQGTMEAKGTYTNSSCGSVNSAKTTARVTQSLKIRIVGRTCQVLQLNQVREETTAWSNSTTKVVTWTERLAPGTKCSLYRPSEQPPPGPPALFGPSRGTC